MNLERLDAFDINFVDSAARREFKQNTSTGMGESRIYVGNDEETLDEFFDFENVEYCLTEKGVSVVPILQSICQWAGIYRNEDSALSLAQCEKCNYRGGKRG